MGFREPFGFNGLGGNSAKKEMGRLRLCNGAPFREGGRWEVSFRTLQTFTVDVSRVGMVLAKLKSNLKRASVKDGIHGIDSENGQK